MEHAFEEELFIELERALDLQNGGAEPSLEPIEPPNPDLAPTLAAAELPPDLAQPLDLAQTLELETAAVVDPHAVSSAGQEELAIVGQYESAGTSYVMYSDGSIEARTERAVFHFKSMAELKTFMESEARTSEK